MPAIVSVPSPQPVGRITSRSRLYNQRIGNYDEALTHYRALLAQNDNSAEVHNNLGLIAQDQGRLDDAITEYQRAIAIDPKYVKAHNNLGVAFMRSNRPAEAGRRIPRRAGRWTRATSSRS